MGRRIFNLLAAVSLLLFFASIVYCINLFPYESTRQIYWHLCGSYFIRFDALTIYLCQRIAGASPWRDVVSIASSQLTVSFIVLPAIWAIGALNKTAAKEMQIQKSGTSQPRSRCDSCGCESPLTAAFIHQPVSFRRGRTRCLCPACFKRQRTRRAASSTVSFLLAGALFCATEVYIRKIGGIVPRDRAVNFGLFIVFIYLLLIPHEMGHAIAAWLCRWEVFRINFGIGPCWLRGSIAGIPIQFRLIPDRGSVSTSSLRQDDWRFCRFITIAAGPLANLAIAILAIEFVGGWKIFINDPFASIWSTLALASGLQFLGSIIPQTHLMQEGPIGSDGLQMAQLLFKPLPAEKVRRLRYYMAKGLALEAADRAKEALEVFSTARTEFPDEPSIAVSVAGMLMTAGKIEEGRTLVCELLRVHTSQSVFNAILRNDLAWADVLLGSTTLLAEADEASAAALSQMPWEASVQGTRGTVLAILGKPDEAMQLLRKSIKGADRRSSRSTNFCAMAIAEHRQGHERAATELIKKARHLDPKCDLLSRAEQELAGHPVALPPASVQVI